jgi:hypothetical protein
LCRRRAPVMTFERRLDVDVDTARRRLAAWKPADSLFDRHRRRRLELEVEPWTSTGSGTLLVLRPRQGVHVHPTARYFRDGWALLDQVAAVVA